MRKRGVVQEIRTAAVIGSVQRHAGGVTTRNEERGGSCAEEAEERAAAVQSARAGQP